MSKLWFKFILPVLVSCSFITTAQAWDKGIYLTQYTLEQPAKLAYLIKEAKASGINTFIIDHEYYSSRYAPAIAKVKAAGINLDALTQQLEDEGIEKFNAPFEKLLKAIEENKAK